MCYEKMAANLIFNVFDFKNIKNTNDRRLFQNKIYIAQCLGLDLNYGFQWYLFGPYSEELSDDVFNIQTEYENLNNSIKLTNTALQILDTVNFLASIRGCDVTENNWYNMIASLLYLRYDYGIAGIETYEELKDKMIECMPWLKQDEINYAYTICKNINAL